MICVICVPFSLKILNHQVDQPLHSRGIGRGEQFEGAVDRLLQHRPFVGESPEAVKSVGISEAAVVDPPEGQVGMQKLHRAVVDATASG